MQFQRIVSKAVSSTSNQNLSVAGNRLLRATTATPKTTFAPSSSSLLLSSSRGIATQSSLLLSRQQPKTDAWKFTSQFQNAQHFSTTISAEDAAVSDEEKKAKGELSKIVRMIKADLVEMDVNKDGRIDAEELKLVLRKYPAVFSEADIFEIGELFYTSRGGESVSHERFMAAISNALEGKTEVDEEKVVHRRKGSFSHPLGLGLCSTEYMYGKSRGVYSDEELDVKLTHIEPKTVSDKLAKAAVRVVRFLFDTVSMWNTGEITQAKVLRRVIFLETVAGIPGFVAAMNRHFKSLRTFTRDGGMLNMFLDEANNERMHLLSFVRMRDPGMFMRGVVLASQAVVGAGFIVLYAVAPSFCHRFVGYVEEEACHTYTDIINAIENSTEDSDMSEWRTQLAPKIARGYWHLGEGGTVLDMMYVIRADEAEHRDVNHVVSGLKPDQPNPLYNPEEKFDEVLQKYVQNMLQRGRD